MHGGHDCKAVWGEVIAHDAYGFRRWKDGELPTIIDIGANVGIFSLFAHFRHPEAKILCIEPCKNTFQNLRMNVGFIHNIITDNIALGKNSPLFFFDTGYSGCNLFYEDNKQNNYSIDGLPLHSLLKKHNITPDNSFIKIDCEGGERYLLADEEETKSLTKAKAIALEIHFPPTNANAREWPRFKDFPPWDKYDKWIKEHFQNFNSKYKGNKKRGYGTFLLTRKDS